MQLIFQRCPSTVLLKIALYLLIVTCNYDDLQIIIESHKTKKKFSFAVLKNFSSLKTLVLKL